MIKQTIDFNRCIIELCNGEEFKSKAGYKYYPTLKQWLCGPTHVLIDNKWKTMEEAESIDDSFSCYTADGYYADRNDSVFLEDEDGNIVQIIGGELLPFKVEIPKAELIN